MAVAARKANDFDSVTECKRINSCTGRSNSHSRNLKNKEYITENVSVFRFILQKNVALFVCMQFSIDIIRVQLFNVYG